jgi:tetratricopeptide (TPR) repeat protein
MKLLLDKGANIEARGHNGYSALLWAVEDGKTNAVKLLLDRGANIEVKNYMGETALDIANRTKSIAMADLIEQAARKRKQQEEAQAKDPRNIFAVSLKVFQQSPKDETLREKVIQVSFNLPEPSPIPEAARQLFALATDQIKQANSPAALDQPIALLRKALEIAPWWSNAYYNLSRALEMRGQYDDAARQLNYYLELKPAEADASEARTHLVVLQAEKDAVAGKQQ